jgi:Ca-activated chloride channel family protein
VTDRDDTIDDADADLRFATAVAAFGMILRDSEYKGDYTVAQAARLAESATGKDPQGRRAGLVKLIGRAAKLHRNRPETGAE